MRFKELHYQTKPLLIANVWDVPSAKITEKQNFQAIGTSSAAIATLLGYDDGEKISFSELEYVVKRIISNTKLPLSVDLEAGYSRNPATIVNHIKKLVQLGVVGINIEDSVVINDIRTLVNADDFAKTLKEITEHLKKENINIFINVRIDTFLLGVSNVIEETKKRIKLYEKTYIDGLFLPCIEKEMEIKEVVNYTNLPINVMCMPNLPDFERLHQLGVKRISMGNFLFDKMYRQLENTMQKISNHQSFQAIF
ncbi:isocitrate lyase/phosphoenolpyruvate mutase family protein [Pasteurella skyensis]|uniref:Isocitrate lyase/phosphoenolpyruvate mutase family protein n=1 Tax=Phocoenobacter skyensis TaxID=97481 RepID=A0AAJ6N8Y8_9PAST|nr:isocitrate lyase/phosphoenolpyruvate mutase family protein [Pasteurella skyensis]MDP8162291.1 isocitrate lyase/phosphoenolpyruvate mutase family protein [Pasteurella skyensis]MDP8172375.1 isocitrate lyase/phosphoenolpyruvate mutase family protein [Pasteurella skyensis]MDP8176956.1 isocitrate lyase/phosphoenolpyruvate mutase family protein [Pasteurella skyensis]MDP8178630.1 isocitrate lyase/phosphoenolpyruvate mutase family protein [Pasteurella skyensis]MDP8182632.1 isocitrate lyase/phosphoe